MSKEVAASSGGIGFFGLLTLIFVIAKIGGYIDWSWWLVFAPVIASVSLSVILVLFVLGAALVAEARR